METEMLRNFLGVCGLINIAMLTLWWVVFMLAHDWIYKMHTKWVKLSEEKFDSIHYACIAFFKLSIFLFNVVPYFALLIVA